MTGLNLTKNVSGATQPQIFHRDLEARAQVIHIKDNAQTFFCCSRQPLQIRNNETGKSLPIGPPHPAPQLVQLPQTEKMCLIDDQRIGPREVQPRFNNGGTNQNVQLAMPKCVHGFFKLLFRQLPMRHADTRIRSQFLDELNDPLQPLHPVMDPKNLPLTGQFPFNHLPKCCLIPLQQRRRNGFTLRRGRLDDRKFADSGHG